MIEKIEVERALHEQQQAVRELQKLLESLNKGVKFLDKAIKDESITEAWKGIVLWHRYAKKTYALLERGTFMQEYLATGKTFVLNRDGRVENIAPIVNQSPVELDPFELQSLNQLGAVFGEDIFNFIEFK